MVLSYRPRPRRREMAHRQVTPAQRTRPPSRRPDPPQSNQRPTHPANRKIAEEPATYLTHKALYLDYPTALKHGWPIATGSSRRLPPHRQRPHGPHRSPVGTHRRRSRPQTTRHQSQPPPRRLLALPPHPRTTPHPRSPLPRPPHPPSGMTGHSREPHPRAGRRLLARSRSANSRARADCRSRRRSGRPTSASSQTSACRPDHQPARGRGVLAKRLREQQWSAGPHAGRGRDGGTTNRRVNHQLPAVISCPLEELRDYGLGRGRHGSILSYCRSGEDGSPSSSKYPPVRAVSRAFV